VSNLPKSLRDVRRDQARERRSRKDLDAVARDRQRRHRELLIDEDRALRTQRRNAVVKGMVPRLSGAIDSWARKRVPLDIHFPSPRLSAATDFKSIRIMIPDLDGDIDVDYAGDLRGLAYHEAGHILKSLPFPQLLNIVVPAEVEHNRRKFLDEVIGLRMETLHHTWNVLEDQRMETAMVRESINLARYYTVVVLTHLVNANTLATGEIDPDVYVLLYGRKYLPQAFRDACRAAYVALHSEDDVTEVEGYIDAYKQATTAIDMWHAVVRLGRKLQAMNAAGVNSVDQHEMRRQDDYSDYDDEDEGFDSGEEEDEGPAITIIIEGADPGDADGEDDDDNKGKGAGGGDGEDEDDDEGTKPGKGRGKGKKGDQPTVTVQGDTADREAGGSDASDQMGASGSVNNPDWGRELVQRTLEAARQSRNSDGLIVRDVKAYNDALHGDDTQLIMERIPYVIDPDPRVTTDAYRLTRALRNLMEQARAQVAPSWQGGQRRGILDVNRYLTRQPGDLEFFRDYAEGGDMHLPNMAVSLLLDGSGSMDGYAQALATCAFGVKNACDVVNVPCTVTVYDTDAYLLWSADDRPTAVPYNIVPSGGTDPRRCLDQIDVQQYGKKNHLVIIMTDGGWSYEWRNKLSLAHYQAPDRDLVMFYYKTSPAYGPQGTESCSLTQRIEDLQEIPRYLMRYLLRAM
jgi:hypothetical protein